MVPDFLLLFLSQWGRFFDGRWLGGSWVRCLLAATLACLLSGTVAGLVGGTNPLILLTR